MYLNVRARLKMKNGSIYSGHTRFMHAHEQNCELPAEKSEVNICWRHSINSQPSLMADKHYEIGTNFRSTFSGETFGMKRAQNARKSGKTLTSFDYSAKESCLLLSNSDSAWSTKHKKTFFHVSLLTISLFTSFCISTHQLFILKVRPH